MGRCSAGAAYRPSFFESIPDKGSCDPSLFGASQAQFAQRTCNDVCAYLDKLTIATAQIEQGIFYKSPGKHCAWCDFLPLCLKDTETAERNLIKLT